MKKYNFNVSKVSCAYNMSIKSLIPPYTSGNSYFMAALSKAVQPSLTLYLTENSTSILSENGWHDVAVLEPDDNPNQILLFLHDKSGWTYEEVCTILDAEHSQVNIAFFDTLEPIESASNSTTIFHKYAAEIPELFRREIIRQFGGDSIRNKAFSYMTGMSYNEEAIALSSPIVSRMMREYMLEKNKMTRIAVIYNMLFDTMYERVDLCLSKAYLPHDECDVSRIVGYLMEHRVWKYEGEIESAINALERDIFAALVF